MKERKEAREEAVKEKLRKLAKGFEASFDYDKAISVWEQIEDFEEVARVKGLKADFDAIAMMDLSAELPPPRDNQVILLASLAFIFLGFTILLFLSIDNSSFWNTPVPCCCSSILVIIFAAWGQIIQDEDKKLRDSVRRLT